MRGPAVRFMQDEPRQQAKRSSRGLAHLQDDALGRFALFRPQRKDRQALAAERVHRLAQTVGATIKVNAEREDALAIARKAGQSGRGVDVVLEAAGSPAGFRLSVEAVRPGGEVIWLGKTDVETDVNFRWGALMAEKRIRRSSYGGTRPARDFPMLAKAYLDGGLKLDELITRHIALDQINEGFAALKAGEAIRSVVMF